jgi:hypothetical protein
VAWPQFDAAEVAFWQRLREALAGRSLQLVLASTTTPPPTLGVTHIPVIPSIDAFFPSQRVDPGISLTDLGLDPAALLTREAEWGAPSILPAIETFRRRAMDAIAGHWFHALAVLQPAAVVIWNGQHVIEMILDATCRHCRVPMLYVERAPIPQALFADERGLSAASEVAHRSAWTVSDALWHERAEAVVQWLTAGQRTWWAQPASRSADRAGVRRQLGIPDDACTVLFAAQVDQDTQQFLFSPHFASNLDAFAWLLDRLKGRQDVFVLGKHHPKSQTDPGAYGRRLAASGVPGAWQTNLAIGDAFAAADRVAAVNSTVLYEALARDLPVLAMGDWLLGGRAAAWELRTAAGGQDIIEAWLRAADHTAKKTAWREALAYLLSSSLYSYAPDVEATGVPGASALAARIADLAARSTGRSMPAAVIDRWLAAQSRGLAVMVPGDVDVDRGVGGREGPDEAREWRRAHTLRYQLMEAGAAVDRGRRLIVWGAGAGGRAVDALLARAAIKVAAFVSTSPDRSHVDGRPLLPPSDLVVTPPRDFVLVASRASAEIVPALTSRGFASSEDYQVLDVDLLAALSTGSSTMPGGASPSNP